MNKNSNLYDYCWNIRDPWWVLLRKTVPGYYLRTILVNLPFLALLLGSLGGPEMAKDSMETDQNEQKFKFV